MLKHCTSVYSVHHTVPHTGGIPVRAGGYVLLVRSTFLKVLMVVLQHGLIKLEGFSAVDRVSVLLHTNC